MAFVDRVRILLKAGDGGKGCNSFERLRSGKYLRPNGGSGGRGGDVVVKVDPNVQTLLDFRYQQHFRASDGKLGGSNHKNGARGKDCVILVPPGTIVRDDATQLLVRDLTGSGDSVVVARGGAGGRGNSRFREAHDGEPGEEKQLLLELKLIADVGIIGFPNAGKSSLLHRISDARPQIASFPFTTKSPVLGSVQLPDGSCITVADIPGLIEGAHEGRGLGHEFLRHIERTLVLIHLIDMAGVDGRNPVDDYRTVNREMQMYKSSLLEKPQVIVANKMDLPAAVKNLEEFRRVIRKGVCPVSALKGAGTGGLLREIQRRLGGQKRNRVPGGHEQSGRANT
jgi:GTP-binding protein